MSANMDGMVFYGVILTRDESSDLDDRWRELMDVTKARSVMENIVGNFECSDMPILMTISTVFHRVEYGSVMNFDPVAPGDSDHRIAAALRDLGLTPRKPGWHLATLCG